MTRVEAQSLKPGARLRYLTGHHATVTAVPITRGNGVVRVPIQWDDGKFSVVSSSPLTNGLHIHDFTLVGG